jgi:natural product precursor
LSKKIFINHLKIEKMKKISLKDVKNSLKRDEMRMISGGCGYSCGGTSACRTYVGGMGIPYCSSGTLTAC